MPDVLALVTSSTTRNSVFALRALTGCRDGCSLLCSDPAIFGDRAALDEGVRPFVGDFLVVKREVQQEDLSDISTTKIETGTHHPDLVTPLQAAAAGQEIGSLAIAVNLVGVEVIDDHGLASRVEQALPAVEPSREHQPLILATDRDLRNGREITVDKRFQQRRVLDPVSQHEFVAIEH